MAKPKKGTRRSGEEIEELTRKIAPLIAGGMTARDACEKFDLSEGTYRRTAVSLGLPTRPNGKGNGVVTGSMSVKNFPPRPKKGKGSRTPRPLDMNDVGALAHRMTVIDRKLRGFTALRAERKQVADALLKLLQSNPDPS